MAFTSLLLIVSTSTLILLYGCAIHSPLLAERRHGPLYKGVQLLIAGEQINAARTWTETLYHLNEAVGLLQQTLDDLAHYNATVQAYIQRLGATERTETLGVCLKRRQREIARFDRELIGKYGACRRSVVATLTDLPEKTFAQVAHVRLGEREIGEVARACNASLLTRHRRNAQHAGVVLCVVSRIGQIDQRMRESSEWCIDVVADIIGVASDGAATTCDGFDELRHRFDAIETDITDCVRAGGALPRLHLSNKQY